MSDQADSLRALARSSLAAQASPACETKIPAIHTLHFVGAKGGVGTSNIVINLGVALAMRGQRVRLLDANPRNRDLAPLCSSLDRRSAAIFLHGIEDSLSDVADITHSATATDWLLIDAGESLDLLDCQHAGSSQCVLVTTPEPIALASARRVVERKSDQDAVVWRVVIAQSASVFEAREAFTALVDQCRRFSDARLSFLGHVRTDGCLRHAVRSGTPVVSGHPQCSAARCVRRIAQTLMDEFRPRSRTRRFAFVARRNSNLR